MYNTLREKIEKNTPLIATRINSSWPLVAEIVGNTKYYDYIEFLAEYAPYNQYDLENIARVCELHNISSIIKVDYANREYVAQKAVASGFQGVLFADHTHPEDIEESIKMVTPASSDSGGRLGYISRRFHKNSGFNGQLDYAKKTNQVVVGFMIEKQEAVENISKICAIPEVDFIQFGPADYSMNCGFDYKKDRTRTKEVEKKVIDAAFKYNKSVRVEVNNFEEAVPYIEMGIRHIAVGSELRILQEHWQNNGQKLFNQLHE